MAQLGDLIVSGKARFLNKISGNIDSADKVNNKLTLTVSGDGIVAYDYDGSSPVSVNIGSVTPAEHTHGNIQNGGTLQTNDITIASGDKLVVTDSSDSSRIARTSLSFDGSTTTQCLTKKGTWATFGTSNLTIGTTSTTAMAGNTAVNNVTQTATSTNATYELLFSGTADNTTRNEGARKTSGLTFNPSTGALNVSGSLNFASTSLTSSMNAQGLTVTQTGNSTTSIAYGTIGISDRSDSISMSSSDITLSSKWDGTNTSLKTAVTGAKGTVTQTATDSTNTNYEILFSSTADNTTRTEGARKTQYLNFNPSTHTLTTYDSSYATMLMPNAYYTTDTTTMSKIAAIGINSGSAMIQLGDSGGGIGASTTDIVLSGTDNTWDGTNTSLKTAIKDKVSKSSGTTVDNPISGAIAITDNFFSKASSVDLSKSNNNLSSDYFGLVDFRDKNKKRFGYIQYGVRTSGGTDASLRAVNFPAGGTTEYTNSLTLVTSKAGAYTYSVTNATNFRTAIGAAAASSIKTKENISDLTEDEALKLLEIRPVSFDYKQGFDIDNKYERNYGVIAEETLDIIPSVVNVPTTEGWEFDETKGTNQELITVDYAKFVPYLIKLVQMQQQEIDELKKR